MRSINLKLNDKKFTLFIRQKDIKHRIKQLVKEIETNYDKNEQIIIVGILKGAFIFVSDLVRAINREVIVDFMQVSSYGMSTQSSGNIVIIKDITIDIKNKNVIIVDDILDTGLTLKQVYEHLKTKNPKSIKTCVLLDKKEARKVPFEADFVGFEIPNKFVIGYGLDYAELGRNLPHIYIVND